MHNDSDTTPMSFTITSNNRFCFGGDWNPEQWDETTWESDLNMLEHAGINEATINIFSWALLQPDANHFDFRLLDRIVNLLVKHGFGIVMGTSTAALPAWAPQQYPDITRTDHEGRHRLFGLRHNACPNSQDYQRMSYQLAGALSARYSTNRNLIAWHISNEYGGNCYCDNCAAAFRTWLKQRYGDLDAINQAWNTNFWSHTYSDFEQILPPNALSDGIDDHKTALSGCGIDYKRFQSESLLNCYIIERDSIRRYDTVHPITTNLMDIYEGLDYFAWGQQMDVISWDDYPSIATSSSDNAFKHDLMRGIGRGKPFMLMESTPSQTNWQSVNALKQPGEMRLQSYQAIAHGADTIQFFQLRQSYGGFEKYHGGIISHRGKEDERIFREVKRLGSELKAHGESFLGGETKSEVAFMFDWDSYWSLESTSLIPESFNYRDQVLRWYAPFHRRNIAVDVVPEKITLAQLSQYKLLVAPALIMVKPGVKETVEQFVHSGGTFLTTIMSGMHDQNDNIILGGYPGAFRDVCGLYIEELDMYPKKKVIQAIFPSSTCSISVMGSIIKPAPSTRTLAIYDGDIFYKGTPVATANDFGQGTAIFVGAVLDSHGSDRIVDEAITDSGLHALQSPKSIEVAARIYPKRNEQLTFILNHSNQTIAYTDTPFQGAVSVLDGASLPKDLILKPYGVIIARTTLSDTIQ